MTVLTDSLIVVVAVFSAQALRFGIEWHEVIAGSDALNYTMFSALLALGWIIALQVAQASDRRILGEGAQEYTRILHATVVSFGLLAIIAVILKLDLARGYLAVALPAGLFFLLFSRWVWRQYLGLCRSRGHFQHFVVVAGGSTLNELLSMICDDKENTWNVVGACRTDGILTSQDLALPDPSTPVIVSWRNIRQLVLDSGADTVAVSGADSIGLNGMRELSWDLEGLDVDLLVAPGIMDVAGPRMHLRPVSGLPLLHVDSPSYKGANQFSKVLFDKLGALSILVLTSPVLLACALAVKATSKGPIFYTSERMGVNNDPFEMIKFRSMVVGADSMREQLAEENEAAGGVLFKIKDDPRVTRVGKFLRRYSLDELPQLFNVVKGDMSLVGPRPPLRDEVEKYTGLVSRRMLVRPGMTGLWQVSGRSNLSWEESVRLDLTYVENWSLMQDSQILWRTARAVVSSDGAY